MRWIPHNRMLADGLTKILSKANLIPLLKAMHHGKYKIVSDIDEETHRNMLKERGETRTRLKGITSRQEVDLGTEFMTNLYVVNAVAVWICYHLRKKEYFNGFFITVPEHEEKLPD